jgi:uncharacterized protein YoxC
VIAPAKFVGSVWSAAGIALPAGAIAVVHFGQTISVTAIIVAAAVVVLGGVFTLRNNMRSFWRDLAEERKEQIAQLEDEVRVKGTEQLEMERRHNAEMLKVSDEQREIRHALKTKLAEMGHLLDIEKAKHDLTAVTEHLDSLDRLALSRGEMFDRLDRTVTENATQISQLLQLMTAKTEGGTE